MRAFFWNHIHINDESASWRWALSLGAAIALFPIVGSGIDAIVVGMMLFSLNYWFFADFKISRLEKTAAWIIFFYVGVSLLFPLLHENPYEGVLFGLSNIGLICLVLLMPVLRHCGVYRYHDTLVLAFPTAGVLMLVGILVEGYIGTLSRAELMTGNSLMLAFLAGVTLIGCSVFGFRERRRRLIFFTIGFLSSLFVLIFTGSRAPIFVAIVLCVLYIFIQGFISKHRKTNIFIAGLFVAGVMGVILLKDTPAFKYLAVRSANIVERVTNFDRPIRLDKSTQMRLAYYDVGAGLVKDHFFLGIGRVNVMNVAQENAPKQIRQWFEKTHLHNGYLMEIAANGLFGLLSLLLVLALPVIVGIRKHSATRHFAFLFAAFFGMYGFTNVSFYHDLTVFPFVVYVLFVHIAQTKPAVAD